MLRTTVRFRPQPHWTPTYLRDRVSLALYELRNPGVPWLTSSMVQFLESWLKPSDIGVEWGSGASTRWFASRVSHLTSIEYNKVWFKKIQNDLECCNIMSHVDYRYFEQSDHLYYDFIDELADNSLDFCLVDGAVRDECAYRALNKVKPGGLLIIDNINRYMPRLPPSKSPHSLHGSDYPTHLWQAICKQLDGWRCFWTTNGVTDTAAWVKPCR
jgi:hypothetical protein